MWGMASHGCIGREIAVVGITSMIRVCAQLKGLRRAPGAPGQMKWIPGPLGSRKYLNDDWSRFSPFATSKYTSATNLSIVSLKHTGILTKIIF